MRCKNLEKLPTYTRQLTRDELEALVSRHFLDLGGYYKPGLHYSIDIIFSNPKNTKNPHPPLAILNFSQKNWMGWLGERVKKNKFNGKTKSKTTKLDSFLQEIALVEKYDATTYYNIIMTRAII